MKEGEEGRGKRGGRRERKVVVEGEGGRVRGRKGIKGEVGRGKGAMILV